MRRVISLFIVIILLAIFLVGCGGSGNPTMTSNEVTEKLAICVKGQAAAANGGYYYSDALTASSSTSSLSAFQLSKQLTAQSEGLDWTGPDAEGWYSTELGGQTIKCRYLSNTNTYEYSQEIHMETTGTTMETKILFSGTKGSDGRWNGSMTTTTRMVSDTEDSLSISKMDFTAVDETYGCGTYKGYYSQSGTMFTPVADHQYLDLTATYDAGTDKVNLVGWYSSQDTVSDEADRTSFNKSVSPHRVAN